MDRTAYNLEVVQKLTKNLLYLNSTKPFSSLDNLVQKKGVLLYNVCVCVCMCVCVCIYIVKV
jgi:hypothetical protein